MEPQMPNKLLLGVGLLLASLVSLTLGGCKGSGGTQNSASGSGTTVSVVFPQQSAMVPEEGPATAAAWQLPTPQSSFARLIGETIRFYEVKPAYAQVAPSNVASLRLIITGPDIPEPIRREIDRATGRTTVPVPVGRARVFEVQAFPFDLPIANFIGRSTADVSPSGANVTVNMQAVTLNSIQVTPPNPQIAKGTIQRFAATGSFSDGTVQDLTPLVNWTSSNTSAAVVSNADGIEGVASGIQEGMTQISATLSNVTGETTLTVTAAEVVEIFVTPPTPSMAIGIRLQFHATGLFTDGSSQDLTLLVSWASSNQAVASINVTGQATALTIGATIISATFQDVIGDTSLTVTPVQLAAITVMPPIPSIAIGTRLQFVATGLFTDGTSQDLTNAASWTSSTASVATITNPGGLAVGVAQGSTTISATLQGVIGSATLSVRNVQLAAITVTPSIPSIAIGTRLQFVATGIFTDGTSQDLTDSATWVSSDPAIAAISNTPGSRGLATAIGQGNTTISATFQNVAGIATLTARDLELAAITITPAIATIAVGTRLRFTATGIFTDGTSQDLTNSATWIASPVGICAIDPTRRATGVAAGTCTIGATFRSLIGTATLTVTAAEVEAITVTPPIPTVAVGTRLQFTGTGLLSDGTSQDLTTSASWTSSPGSICSIDPTTGLATALAVGICTISATFQGISGDAILTVTAARLEAITVTPAIPTIGDGTTLQFTATGIFTDGTSQDLTPSATWMASPATICAIDPIGEVIAVAAGTCTISATLQGVTGSTTLTVTPALLVQLTVTPVNPTIADGTTLQFTATGILSDGTVQNLTESATWVSTIAPVASVSDAAGTRGLATALAAGSTVISATFQGITGTTILTVTPAPLVQITVTPVNPTIADGTTLQFTATGILSDGTVQNLTTSATWMSSNPVVATISNATGSQGLATALAAGSTTISASFQGVTGTTLLTVTMASFQIAVTPANPTIADGTTLQFTATGIFTDGPSQELTADVTWTSSNTAVAQISNASESEGLATALAAGSTTISATFQGITGTTILTVTPAPLVQITVTPVNPTIADGTTLQFTATGILSDGTVQNLTTSATWMSSNPAVATISNATSSQGLATALAAGSTTISAIFQDLTGSAILTVTASPLVEIAVSTDDPDIGPGATTQFTAIGIFEDGTVQDITLFVTWASSNQYVAEINPQGLATANGFGTTTISATFQGVVGSAILLVDGYGSSIGITKMTGRFLGIIGTASLTVMLLGLFFRGRAGEGPAGRPNRRE